VQSKGPSLKTEVSIATAESGGSVGRGVEWGGSGSTTAHNQPGMK